MLPTIKVNDAVLIPDVSPTGHSRLYRVMAITKDGRACVNKYFDGILIEPEVGTWEKVGHYTEIKPHWFWRIMNCESSSWEFIPD